MPTPIVITLQFYTFEDIARPYTSESSTNTYALTGWDVTRMLISRLFRLGSFSLNAKPQYREPFLNFPLFEGRRGFNVTFRKSPQVLSPFAFLSGKFLWKKGNFYYLF